MRNAALRFIAVFAMTAPVHADVVMHEDFEDAIRLYTTSTPEFSDGGSDYFGIHPVAVNALPRVAYTGFGGSGYFAVEDMDDGGTRPGTGTLSFNVNITGFESLNLDISFAAGGNSDPEYDNSGAIDDGFLVRATIDSDPLQNLLAFESTGTNTVTRQDTDFDGTGDGLIPSSAFADYNLPISGTGSNLLLEIIITSNDGHVEYAFDDVIINGTAVPEPSSFLFLGMLGSVVIGWKKKRQLMSAV